MTMTMTMTMMTIAMQATQYPIRVNDDNAAETALALTGVRG